MGRPKLLLPWGSTTVLGATVGALQGGGARAVYVAVAPDGPLAGWRAPSGVRVVVNPDPTPGMLSSILAALDALAAAGDATPDPLLVCPADLPSLRPETVATLLDVYGSLGGVVVPRHGRRRGHPLLIPAAWQRRIPELSARHGGLRQILELAAGAVHEVAVEDPGTVRDVDTPEAYERLRPR
jgi:molybdenum cofactor cytidylyltransferase